MKHPNKKLLLRAAAGGFLLAAALSFHSFAAACEGLSQDVIRLHVVAHSDGETDQAVKLLVRDAVLTEAARWYGDAATPDEAVSALCLHLDSIRAAADKALSEAGAPQRAGVVLTRMYFPTRAYEGFTLPAGRYRTLRVTIGEGAGHNWWCVVFPALCLPAAEDSPEDVLALLPENEREAAENPQKYRVELKAVELYRQLQDWLGTVFS